MDDLPDVWDEARRRQHVDEECPQVIDASTLDNRTRTHLCGCGEVWLHTPLGRAHAELNRDIPQVPS